MTPIMVRGNYQVYDGNDKRPFKPSRKQSNRQLDLKEGTGIEQNASLDASHEGQQAEYITRRSMNGSEKDNNLEYYSPTSVSLHLPLKAPQRQESIDELDLWLCQCDEEEVDGDEFRDGDSPLTVPKRKESFFNIESMMQQQHYQRSNSSISTLGWDDSNSLMTMMSSSLVWSLGASLSHLDTIDESHLTKKK